jgi:hypothetical protein
MSTYKWMLSESPRSRKRGLYQERIFPPYKCDYECEHETLKSQILEKVLLLTLGNLKGTYSSYIASDSTKTSGKFSDFRAIAGNWERRCS